MSTKYNFKLVRDVVGHFTEIMVPTTKLTYSDFAFLKSGAHTVIIIRYVSRTESIGLLPEHVHMYHARS